MKDERHQAPEILFQPTVAVSHLMKQGLHDLVFESIDACSPEIKRELYQAVVLSGGTMLLPGLPARLQNELTKLAPQGSKIKVVSSATSRFSAWRGGSILASLTTFQSQWITKQAYDENGVDAIHRKCF